MAHYLRLVFETVHLVEATSEATILQQMVHVGEGGRRHRHQLPPVLQKGRKDHEVRLLPEGHHRGHHRQPPVAPGPVRLPRAAGPQRYVSFVDSLVGPLSILNALIVTVAIKKKNEVADTLRKIEEIWDEYGVYEKVDEKGS